MTVDINDGNMTFIKEHSMGFAKVYLYTFFLVVLITFVCLLSFIRIWDYELLIQSKDSVMKFFFYILISGVITHELLHGLSGSIFTLNGLKSIKFGFKWKYLTPYCHCKEPLKVKHYRIMAATPLIVLGILPAIYAIIIGDGTVFFWGVLFTCVASGDIIVLFMLRKFNKEVYVSDHPNKMGFYIKTDKVSK